MMLSAINGQEKTALDWLAGRAVCNPTGVSMSDYIDFLKRKASVDPDTGLKTVPNLNPMFMAIKTGRRFVGSELKTAYFNQAVKNIESARNDQGGLFELEVA